MTVFSCIMGKIYQVIHSIGIFFSLIITNRIKIDFLFNWQFVNQSHQIAMGRNRINLTILQQSTMIKDTLQNTNVFN